MSHYRRKMGCEGNSCLAHIILIKLNICQFTLPKTNDYFYLTSDHSFPNPTHLIYLLVSLFVYLKLPHFGWLFNLAHIFIFNYTTIQKLGIRENFFLNSYFQYCCITVHQISFDKVFKRFLFQINAVLVNNFLFIKVYLTQYNNGISEKYEASQLFVTSTMINMFLFF